MPLTDFRVVVLPGPGIVARKGYALVSVIAPEDRHAPFVEKLLVLLAEAGASGPTPGRQLARSLAAALSAESAQGVPAFATLADVEEGLGVVVHGAAEVLVEGKEGPARLSGARVASWVDQIVQGPISKAVVGASPLRQDLGAVRHAAFDLREGVVPGGGVALFAAQPVAVADVSPARVPLEQVPPVAAPSPVEEREVPPEEEVAPQRSGFVSVLLHDGAAEPARDPLPIAGDAPPLTEGDLPGERGIIVKGIRCARGHFNNPKARFCAICGIGMIQRTHVLEDGERLPLGVLVLDDGATFALDADYVIGRDPSNDPDVRSGQARPLVVADDKHTVSRVHAAIVLREWDVTIADRSSANGTDISERDAQGWTRLVPEQPVIIRPGTKIKMGDRVVVFDSHYGSGFQTAGIS